MRRLIGTAAALPVILGLMTLAAASTLAAPPEFLKNLPDTFEQNNGPETLLVSLAKEVIECAKVVFKGEIKTATTGVFESLTYTKCESLGFLAHSLGDGAGEISFKKVAFETCYIKETPPLEAALFIKGISTHVEVPLAGILINIEGTLIATLNETKKNEFPISFSQTGGDPNFNECRVGGVVKKAELTLSSDAKHEKKSMAGLLQFSRPMITAKEHQLDL